MKPRWRKVIADIGDSKMRTILVVASIAVGVFAVGAIASAYIIMAADINTSYAAINPANIEIVTDFFDDDLIEAVEKMDGVAEVEGELILGVRASVDGDEWQSIDLVVVEDFDSRNINQIESYDGELLAEDRQLLMGFESLKDSGYRTGDILTIQMPEGTERVMPVVGLVTDQSSVGNVAAPSLGYVNRATLEWLGRPSYYNRLNIVVSEGQDDLAIIEAIAETIEERVEKTGRNIYRIQTRLTDEHPMADLILAVLGVLGALGVLVMLLSGSLIFNTLNALLSQHLRQIGVMKLVGARSQQISGMYILLILIYGAIALVISIPTAAVAGYYLAKFIADLMNANLQGFRVIPAAMGLQVAIAVIVPLLAGFFPINRGAKTTVRRALSDSGIGSQAGHSSALDGVSRWLKWVSRPLLLSVRNTFRRKGRLALTLFTLTMAGAIFIAVFNVRDSLESFIDQVGRHFLADVTVYFDWPYRASKVERAVFEIEGITGMEAWAAAVGEVLDEDDHVVENLQIFAPPADSALLDADILAGRWLLPGEKDALVLSDSILNDYPDLQPGDQLRISIMGQRAKPYTIVGLFRFTDMVGDTLGYSEFDVLNEIMHTPDQAVSYRLIASAQTMAEQGDLSRQMDRYLRSRGFKVSYVESGLVTRSEMGKEIDVLVVFLLIMALLTAFVGSIGLAGTMGMNVLERTREIGVMRAIGADDFAIMKSVVIEGMLIGFISWLLGIALSFPISSMLLKIVGDAMINAALPLKITPIGSVLWLGVVVVLSAIASLIPARNASRLTIREVLAYE